MAQLIKGYFGGQTEQRHTVFGPALSWYRPLVASQLGLRAVSCSAAGLGPPFCLQARLFCCHQSRLRDQREVRAGCFHWAWRQLPVARTPLHSLLFSLPATQTQIANDKTWMCFGRCSMAYTRWKVKHFLMVIVKVICWDEMWTLPIIRD